MSPFGLKFSQMILHTENTKTDVQLILFSQKFYTNQHSYPVPLKEHCTQKKNMNSLNVEYFLAMNIQNLDKNG